MDDLGPRVLLDHVLGGLLHVIVEGNGLVPELPEDEAEAVGIHLRRLGLYLFARLEGFGRRPDARDPVVKEHIAVDHEVVVLKVRHAHLYLVACCVQLLDVDEDVVGRQVTMRLDAAEALHREHYLAQIVCYFVLYSYFGGVWLVLEKAVQRLLLRLLAALAVGQYVAVQQLEETRALRVEQRDLELLVDVVVRRLQPYPLDARHLEQLNQRVLEFLDGEDRDARYVDLPRNPPTVYVLPLGIADVGVEEFSKPVLRCPICMPVPCLFVWLQDLERLRVIDLDVLGEVVADALYHALVLLHRCAAGLARRAARHRVHPLRQHEVPRVLEHYVAAHGPGRALEAEYGWQPVMAEQRGRAAACSKAHDLLAELAREDCVAVNGTNIHVPSVDACVLVVAQVLLPSLVSQNQVKREDSDEFGISNHKIRCHIEDERDRKQESGLLDVEVILLVVIRLIIMRLDVELLRVYQVEAVVGERRLHDFANERDRPEERHEADVPHLLVVLRGDIRCARVPAVEPNHQDVLDQDEEANNDKRLRLEPFELILIYHNQENEQQLQKDVNRAKNEQRVFEDFDHFFLLLHILGSLRGSDAALNEQRHHLYLH